METDNLKIMENFDHLTKPCMHGQLASRQGTRTIIAGQQMAVGECRSAVCNFKSLESSWEFRFENGESRLQGSSDSRWRRMLFSYPMWWDTGVVANQRLGKGEGWAWFDDFPGSDHHGSMCHARTTTRASRLDAVFV